MSWIKKHRRHKHIMFMKEVSALCSELGGPLASQLNDYVQADRLRELLEDTIIKYEYSSDPDDLFYARQILALVEKQDSLDLGYDTEARAHAKFVEMEEKCRQTNIRLASASPNGDVAAVIHGAQRKIASVLGQVPSLDTLDFSFGPGAATNVKGAEACFRAKLSASLTCSADMAPYVGDFLKEFPLWHLHHATPNGVPEVVLAKGKLEFVPKNSKTDRAIVIEPLLNGLAQKGIGSYLKRRLLRYGLDLRTQERNKEKARKGSIDGSLATIDLSSASDCISIRVVLDLLPIEWFDFLSNYRTGTVTYRGESIELQKFSSMGNGYTFELESLIFWALCLAACDHLGAPTDDVCTFGDDMIVPSASAELLVATLEYLGFQTNRDKSFFEGPFRESCGADWFKGIDIRPFYLKERISDEKLYCFHNWAVRNGETRLAALILEWTKPNLRIFGPDGYGDGHLIGTYTLRLNRKLRRAGYCGGFFDTYSRRAKRYRLPLPGDWLVPSYSVYTRSGERDPTDPDIVRGSHGYARMSIYTLATSVFRK